ncbi:MAG TPA: protein-disulfide reductase DsbD domain-containing protein [Caulobacterales bacterium]|nr:protein-disulfide reductase DsbD domain-containing protein [Caulobacterales bacterium]
MRSIALVCAAAGLLALIPPSQAAPFRTDNVEGELVSSRAVVAPGETFTVALHEKIRDGWHTYWRNPGDSGEPTTITWNLPAGFSAAPNEWPAPTIDRTGPITTYVYEHEVFLPMQITAPANLKPGPVDLTAKVRWLVCSDVCIPEEGQVSLRLDAGGTGRDDPAWASKLKAVRDRLPKPEGVSASLTRTGEAYQLTVTGGPIVNAASLAFLPYENDKIDHAAEQPIAKRADGATLTLTPSVAEGLGKGPLAGVLLYQVNESGRAAPRAVEIEAPGLSAAPPPAPAAPKASGAAGIVAALGLAFLGGLILNVMPCVFPVLSLKALSLARGGEQAEARRHGVIFVLGVMATFLALAGTLIALQATGAGVGWGFQLQEPLVVGALALLFFVIGLNLIGAFEIGGGVQNAGSSLASRGGDAGAFFTGALAVVAATPCTAPFMGAALGFAATQPPLQSLLVFAALGFGFAAPFAALSFFPVLRAWLPKPGAWMNRFKELLAFPMFAAAAWLVWVLGRLAGADGVVAALAAFIGIGFAVWAWRAFSKAPPRLLASLVALVLLVLAAIGLHAAPAQANSAGGSSLPLHGERWTPEREAALRAQGRPVLVNFTAAWCVTCQVNERVAFRSREVSEAFAATNAAYLEADWTAQDAVIAKTLAAHGRAGVPLYLFYPAKGGDPEVLPQLLTPGMVVEAVKRAAAAS